MDIQGIKLQLCILEHTDSAAELKHSLFILRTCEYIRFSWHLYLHLDPEIRHSPADRRRSERTVIAPLGPTKNKPCKSASQPPERTGYLAGKGVLCLKIYTLYKLIVLYMLEKLDFPLSNRRFPEFILELHHLFQA